MRRKQRVKRLLILRMVRRVRFMGGEVVRNEIGIDVHKVTHFLINDYTMFKIKVKCCDISY